MVNKILLKNLETNRNSVEELKQYMTHVNEHAWSYSYLYPEDFGPAKFPDNHSFPTTISTNRMIKQFKPNNNGTFVIYYCPVNETFASYFNIAKEVNTGLNLGQKNEYIVYADSSNAELPLINGSLKNASEWPTIVRPAPKFQNFKMIRLIGASIEIFVDDVERNFEGQIEAGVSFAVAGQGIGVESIKLDQLQNFSNFSRFSTKDPLIFRYRAPNINFMQFGPYEPFVRIPYFIITGKGISSTATIGVVMTNHIEGVFWPELAHFSFKPKHKQKDGSTQAKDLENAGSRTIMDSDPGTNITNRITQTAYNIGDIKFYHPLEELGVFSIPDFKDPDKKKETYDPTWPYTSQAGIVPIRRNNNSRNDVNATENGHNTQPATNDTPQTEKELERSKREAADKLFADLNNMTPFGHMGVMGSQDPRVIFSLSGQTRGKFADRS